jgi:TonB family protein
MANYTILLIDYEPRSIERFRDPLTAAGYTVEIATDGVSGIEAFHRLSPDMVLVEAMIPKKHGFEVCQELKRTPHGRQTPVIITTGVYKGRKYRTQALHIYGCDEYIEKPIAAEQLLALVGKFFVSGSPGSSGSSGSSTRGTEAGPVTSEPGAAPSARSNADAIAKPAPTAEIRSSAPTRTKPISVAPMVLQYDTEDEIMARLDEILPGARPAPPRAEPSPIAVGGSSDTNPFARMRDELDAELGAVSGPLAFEVAPKLVPMPEARSDQALSPSVLEALPVPDPQIAIAPVPAEIPLAKEEQPGQVVSFDTKRSRKHRKAEKQSKANAPQSGRVASATKAAASPTVEAPIRVAEVAVPRGTIVASEIDAPAGRRSKPVILWLAVGAVALASVYLVFPRGESGVSITEPVARPTPKRLVSAPLVAEPPPVASAPAEPVQLGPEPLPNVLEKPKPTPGPATVKAAAPKKPADRVTTPATAPSTRKAAPAAPTAGTGQPTVAKLPTPGPVPAAPAPAHAATAAPPPAVEAPQGLETSGAGVEAIPDSPSAPPTTKLQRGQLIPIDEADTLPVPLTHRSPFYSTEAIQNRITGTVIMNVLVNDHGTVDQVVLVTGVTGGDVNDAAIRAAKSWTYRPATKNGVPVKVWRSERVVVKP